MKSLTAWSLVVIAKIISFIYKGFYKLLNKYFMIKFDKPF